MTLADHYAGGDITPDSGDVPDTSGDVPDASSGIRCMCSNFFIRLRPNDELSDARSLLEIHLRYCPAAKESTRQDWGVQIGHIAEKVFNGSSAFMVLALMFGWAVHAHGWPW